MNDSNSLYLNALWQWLPQLPTWLVLLGGLIVALTQRARHPRPAGFVVAAVAVLGVSSAVYPFVSMWLISARISHAWTMQTYGIYALVIGVGFHLLMALGYGLLLAAAFAGRGTASPVPPTLPTQPNHPVLP